MAAHDTLITWLRTQKNHITKASAVLTRAIHICNVPAEQLDTLSLEVLTTNLIMQIDVLNQYNKCIRTLLQSSNTTSSEIITLYNNNQTKIEKLEKKYKRLQTLSNKKMKTLNLQIHYTEHFLSQLI